MKKQDVKEERDEHVATPVRAPEADQPPPRLRRSAGTSVQPERASSEKPNGDEPGYGYGV